MHVFEFVIFIVAIVFIGGIIRDRQRIKAGYPPMFGKGSHSSACPLCEGLTEAFGDAGEVRDKLAKMSALEDRIQVLERIVTDKRGNLAEEIDNL